MDNNETIVIMHPLLLEVLQNYQKEDSDIAELINEIFKCTVAIETTYQDLYTLITNPDTPNYPTSLRDLLYNLSLLKLEEEDLYDYIEKLPNDLVKSIGTISDMLDTNLDEFNRLAYRRILNNLETILILSDTSFVALGSEYFKNNRIFNFLLDNGLSYEDAVETFKTFKYDFDKSISYRYTTIVNEAIKKETNSSKRKDLIKIKLKTTFVRGNELEDDLIESKFTTVKNDFKKEMESSYGLDPLIKTDYININALMSLHHNINLLKTIKNPEASYVQELIMEFKTFLLYVSDENLKVFTKNLSNMAFATPSIKGELFKAIKDLKEDKKIHYQDSEQKTL